LTREAFPDYDPGIWYELAKDALDTQLAFVDAIDAKLGSFLGTGSALVAILAAVYALKPDVVKDAQVHALALAAFFYVVLAVISMAALMSRKWGTGPDVEALRALAEERNYTDDQIRWKAQSRYVDDVEKNDKRYWLKAWGLRVVLVGLVLETASVAIGLWLLKA
jgi:hypothetical protein